MKVKKIILLALLPVFMQCQDALNVQPRSLITAQSMWSDEGDARSGIAGLMNQFRSTFNGRDYLFWFELRSGFWQFGTSGGGATGDNWRDLFNNTLAASSSPGTNWSSIYQTINAANLAIKYIPDISFTAEQEKSRLLSQAYFVRAFSYFALVRIFGDVPVVLSGFESIDDENITPARQPVTEVFAQIKSDLSVGLGLTNPGDPLSRVLPSRAALNMLKADVYLWTAKRLNGGDTDLAEAESAVDQVLGNSNYQLLDDYENVFRQESNNEIIFAIHFDVIEDDSQYGNQFSFAIGHVPTAYQNNPVIIGSHAQWFTFTDHYVDNYLNGGPPDQRTWVNNGEFVGEGLLYRWINKYIGEWREGSRFHTSDTRIYRYAEALLFKAEILNARGMTPEAVPYLNQIAERAYGVPDYYSQALSSEALDDGILTERLIEFGAEGKSWFDIIRFGKAFERIPSLAGKEQEHDGNILLFPIAPETITRNPNIEQTPGF